MYVALGAGVGVYVGGYEDSETGELVGIVVRFSSTGASVWLHKWIHTNVSATVACGMLKYCGLGE